MKSIDKFVLVLVASLALLLAGCGGGSSSNEPEDPGPTPEELAMQRAEMQMEAIETASGAVDTALAALDGAMPTQAQIDAVNSAITRLDSALSAAADVSDSSKAGYAAQVSTATTAVMNAESALMAVNDAAAEAARMAMATMTAKLWAGIGETPLANNGASTAIAAGDGTLTVQRGTTTATPLEENEDTTVASLHGWEGSEHTATVETADADNIGTYTVQVYSNVGEPTEGAMFNDSYTLDAGGKIADVTSVTEYAGLVASPSFDQSAGLKEFELPTNTVAVMIPGSFNGVAGTYGCTPSSATDTCGATVATSGFTLGGGTWTFTPTDPETRLMNTPDNVYAVYGWWLHETASGTATVSAFHDYRGTPAAAVDIAGLNGTATYKGGAAGKYAISAGTTNDSGHFTADAELKATFGQENGADAHMISGTISNFMGSDDMPRDWSVALKEGPLVAAGTIAPVTDGTTWTMGGTDAAASGQWSGTLYEETDGGIPSVGTGTFHSVFGNTGRMVGAFGVDLED